MLMTRGGKDGLGRKEGRKGFLESTSLSPFQGFIHSKSACNTFLPHIHLGPSLWCVSASSAGLSHSTWSQAQTPLPSR